MQKGFSLVLIIVAVGLLAGVGVGGYWFYYQQKLKSITDFDSCAKYYPVMTSYPGQCNTPDGRHFVQQLSEEEKKKLLPPEPAASTFLPLKTPNDEYLIPEEASLSADETADWKTYKSDEGRYSFQYPSDFSLHINEIHVFESTAYQPEENVVELDGPNLNPSISIYHTQISQNMNINQFIDSNSTCDEINQSSGEKITIDNKGARIFKSVDCGIRGYTAIFWVNQGIGYQLYIDGYYTDDFFSKFLSLIKLF